MAKQYDESTSVALRELPSVGSLISLPSMQEAVTTYGAKAVTQAAREVIDEARHQLLEGANRNLETSLNFFASCCLSRLSMTNRSPLRPVINATGILLHTGLGRAPLANEAIQAAADISRGYCSVEIQLEQGIRSQRSGVVSGLLQQLTGAEAAHVVNNNAGATGLAVAALSSGRELIVSHGELIEIGGGYRLPEVIKAFGAQLRAVGTTNKTRVSDYEQAIGENSGAILIVHPSNYQISGFTSRPALSELVELAARKRIPLIHDVGSGALLDFTSLGCEGEPVVSGSIRTGADLVLFSGDKLLGGPQCGILVGKKHLINQVVDHPFSRALRVDKITLAALYATLDLYCVPERAMRQIPLLRLLSRPVGELRQQAEALAKQLQRDLVEWDITTTCDDAFVGGGSLPHQTLTSWSLSIKPRGNSSVEKLAQRLRTATPAVIGRLHQGSLLLCMHAIFPAQEEALRQTILVAAKQQG